MVIRASLVLLICSCTWTQGLRLDRDRWVEQAALTDGLCRYGNSLECCWGWRQVERGRCRADCQQGCKHGECIGPDRCKCHPGYAGKACNLDLNECGLTPRPCKHRCMNTPGSYKCYCQDGFKLQPDGSCRNARTCFHANCQYGCQVIKGAVRCTCPSPGLRLGPDRRTCVDIDECVRGGGVCPRRRKCVNTFGSFLCLCHPGFKLTYVDGRYTCIDKDVRPFCLLNPASPKCRCKDGGCKAVPKVTLEPHRPRTTTTTASVSTTATVPMTTSTTAATSLDTSTAVHTTPVTTSTPATTPITPVTTPVTMTIASVTTTVKPVSATTTPITPTTIPVTTITMPVTMTATPVTTAVPTLVTTTTTPITTSTTSATTTTTPVTMTIISVTTTVKPVSMTTTPITPTTLASVTTSTMPVTMTTTAVTTTSTPSAGTYQPDTLAPTMTTTTVAPATSTLTTALSATTTVNNRINKEVTHRQRGDVHIPRHPGHNQVWEFDIELGNTADAAGDDPSAFVRHCSFDGGLCDWMSDRDGDLHWETARSSAGGSYLSVQELKAGQRSVRGARLAVQIVPPWHRGDLCFSFSHWLTGHHVGVLQLFVRKKRDQRFSPALWSRTGGHGWRHTEVTLTTHYLDRVLLKAERRKGRRGQIAIDDVTLRQGACR